MMSVERPGTRLQTMTRVASTTWSDERARLAGRALGTMLALASTAPTRSVGDELRRSIATTARRVIEEAAARSEERRRAQRRRRIRRSIVAGAVLAAVVVRKRRSLAETAE
jgi:hypothetical protein